MANTNENQSSLAIVLDFIQKSWPMIVAIVTAWKFISEGAKVISKRQDIRLRELIKAEVTPQFDQLTEAINALREELGRIKGRL